MDNVLQTKFAESTEETLLIVTCAILLSALNVEIMPLSTASGFEATNQHT